MKKTMIILMTELLLIGALAGCGSAPAAQQQNTEPAAEQNVYSEDASAAQEHAEPFLPEGSVIFERDGVKVTTAGLDNDPTSMENDPIIWVDVENNGDADAYLGVANASVNGFMSNAVFIDYYMEDGVYFGGDYEFQLTLPAGFSGRYALGYYKLNVPGVDTDTLGELELCFTLAEDEFTWPDYTSEPVSILTGEVVDMADFAALGTVGIDNETMRLIIGAQDYDDWFGPTFYVYIENKTDKWLGVSPDSAEGDGVFCDYMYGGAAIAPGKKYAGSISFEGELRELKGIENLTLNCSYYEGESFDELDLSASVPLDPINVAYPPQMWGEYENGGLSLSIQPKYNDLITVETPENDENGTLFSVSETASKEAGGYDGAGWLFAIGKVSETRLHEMLCSDMSGSEVFAKDDNGNFYMYYHPTDVRFERSTAEEMERDADQWMMLNEWAESIKDKLIDQNEGLEAYYRGNSMLDIYLARAAYDPDTHYAMTTTEFGTVEAEGFDAVPFAEVLLGAGFFESDIVEAPDGEYVSLVFPEEELRFDFFLTQGDIIREVRGDYECFYETWLNDENTTYADIVLGWYYALAESAGVKEHDASMDVFVGTWAEQIAGRGVVTIQGSLAPGRAKIDVTWPDGAAIENTWQMSSRLDEDGRLVYEAGVWESIEYDEDGEGWIVDDSWEESGYFYLNDSGELIWHNDTTGNDEDSVFVRAD